MRYWFVGAYWQGEDQLDRFLSEGIWENGYEDRYLEKVRSVQPGDRIALRGTFTLKDSSRLPFENHGRTVSVMRIKAIGTVRENLGDGRRLKVDWTRLDPHRDWLFSTYRLTINEVDPGSPDWTRPALVGFAFEGEEQDVEAFLRDPRWHGRYTPGGSGDSDFAWTRFYESLADRLLDFKDNRSDLLKILRELSGQFDAFMTLDGDLHDNGTKRPLADIDPFTVYSIFNRGITHENRTQIVAGLGKALAVEVDPPAYFDDRVNGIPVVDNMKSWFFGHANVRQKDDIDTLWAVFEAAIRLADGGDGLADEEVLVEDFIKAFDDAGEQHGVRWNLTMGLYWIRPWFYPTLDGKSRDFLSGVLGFPAFKKPPNGEDYLALKDWIEARFDSRIDSLPALSLAAWLHNPDPGEGGISGVSDTNASSPSAGRGEAAPRNVIYYGPPGTGKTWRLINNEKQRYTVTSGKSMERRLEEAVEPLTWFEVIALVVADLGGQVSPSDIRAHRYFKARERSRPENQHLSATIHLNLQTHAVEHSGTVRYQNRREPLIFDKDDQSRWSIVTDLPEDLLEHRTKLRDIQGASDEEARNYRLVTFHPSFSYEDFIEGIRPRLDENANEGMSYMLEAGVFKRAAVEALRLTGYPGSLREFCELPTVERRRYFTSETPRYALFVDEVSRGNIAQIFGELIALIEADKRLGAAHELIVELPYSHEKFGVPLNLDLIGTMNTADRSVEALDIALRRRFEFVAVPPDLDELGKRGEIEGVDLRRLLETINERIEHLLDADHAIGHAYLMHVRTFEELREVFRCKIVPLLQEYFYGHWGRIGLVLGKRFVEPIDSSRCRFASGFDSDIADDLGGRVSYRLCDLSGLTAEDIRNIYA